MVIWSVAISAVLVSMVWFLRDWIRGGIHEMTRPNPDTHDLMEVRHPWVVKAENVIRKDLESQTRGKAEMLCSEVTVTKVRIARLWIDMSTKEKARSPEGYDRLERVVEMSGQLNNRQSFTARCRMYSIRPGSWESELLECEVSDPPTQKHAKTDGGIMLLPTRTREIEQVLVEPTPSTSPAEDGKMTH